MLAREGPRSTTAMICGLNPLVCCLGPRGLACAIDANADDTMERVAAFVKKKGLTIPIVLDPSGHAADVFGVTKTTTTVVIDGEGVLRYCGQFRQKSSVTGRLFHRSSITYTPRGLPAAWRPLLECGGHPDRPD